MAQDYEYSGCWFVEHAKTPVDVKATVCYGNRRETFEGPLAVVETVGSWKYGRELHITIHAKDLPKVDVRAHNNNWARIEIAVKFHVGTKLLKQALDSLDENIAKFM